MLFRGIRKRLARSWLGATLGIGLSACAVGPIFQRPAPPSADSYVTAHHLPDLQLGEGETAQHLSTGEAVPREWWRMFHSPALDGMVHQALGANPSIEAAQYTLASARQELREANAAYVPQIDAGVSAERQKGPPLALGIRPDHALPTYDLYAVGATVGFTPDVFGLTARRVEQQRALAENRAYQLAALQLSVTGNVVAQSLRLAAARRRLQLAEDLVANDEQALALVRQRAAAGKVATMDTWSAQARRDEDQAALPLLRHEITTAETALAVLLGQSPAAWTAPELNLDDLVLPAQLPLTLPSELVRQRPDILAAEARLHAASAAVGVADAQMYPQFTLSASVGTAALTTQALGNGSNLVWTLLGGLTAPIFHGGALVARKRAAVDHFHAELALYRDTVLQGLGQVANVLHALGHHAELAASRRGAWSSNEALQQLQRQRYASGKVGELAWLDSQRRALRAHSAYEQALVLRYLDSADLMVALGGHWPTPTVQPCCNQATDGCAARTHPLLR
ncbi:MAG TPA: efflux transporter outer membrane subunit [Rhodanobacter sp.]|nr:efflux transporter outer membrane subunit [Rhodanobacter sp.]